MLLLPWDITLAIVVAVAKVGPIQILSRQIHNPTRRSVSTVSTSTIQRSHPSRAYLFLLQDPLSSVYIPPKGGPERIKDTRSLRRASCSAQRKVGTSIHHATTVTVALSVLLFLICLIF